MPQLNRRKRRGILLRPLKRRLSEYGESMGKPELHHIHDGAITLNFHGKEKHVKFREGERGRISAIPHEDGAILINPTSKREIRFVSWIPRFNNVQEAYGAYFRGKAKQLTFEKFSQIVRELRNPAKSVSSISEATKSKRDTIRKIAIFIGAREIGEIRKVGASAAGKTTRLESKPGGPELLNTVLDLFANGLTRKDVKDRTRVSETALRRIQTEYNDEINKRSKKLGIDPEQRRRQTLGENISSGKRGALMGFAIDLLRESPGMDSKTLYVRLREFAAGHGGVMPTDNALYQVASRARAILKNKVRAASLSRQVGIARQPRHFESMPPKEETREREIPADRAGFVVRDIYEIPKNIVTSTVLQLGRAHKTGRNMAEIAKVISGMVGHISVGEVELLSQTFEKEIRAMRKRSSQ